LEATQISKESKDRGKEEMTDIITTTYIYLALHPITDLLIVGGLYLVWKGYKKYMTGGKNDTLQTG
jgi:hypothetical protein